MSELPLQGVTVLDCTRLLPGAFATQILADLGATVWKIEEPGRGDYMRYAPPLRGEMSAYFFAYNRGKKSVCINLKSPAGQEIVKKWVKEADLFVESFRPGVMTKLGLDAPALKRENAKLITCSITGYGQNGPYSERAGHDANFLSLAGALDLQGVPERPLLSPFQLADCAGGGLSAVIAMLLALYTREKKSQGASLDVSMFENLAYWMNPYYAMASWGEKLEREKLPLSGLYPNYRVYRTQDNRFLSVGALEPKFLEKLLQAISLPPHASLEESLPEVFAKKTLKEWEELLHPLDACTEPVRTPEEALQDPHLGQRSILQKNEELHLSFACSPLRVNESTFCAKAPPPKLGEHTHEKLRSLGYTEEELKKLKSEKVI